MHASSCICRHVHRCVQNSVERRTMSFAHMQLYLCLQAACAFLCECVSVCHSKLTLVKSPSNEAYGTRVACPCLAHVSQKFKLIFCLGNAKGVEAWSALPKAMLRAKMCQTCCTIGGFRANVSGADRKHDTLLEGASTRNIEHVRRNETLHPATMGSWPWSGKCSSC